MRMRLFFALTALFFTATAASARPMTPEHVQHLCQVYADAAGKTAESRYTGTPKQKALEGAGTDKMLQLLVQRAYALPNHSAEASRKKETKKFVNSFLNECVDAFEPAMEKPQ